MSMRILSLGDRAFTVEYAPGFDATARAAVVHLDAAIKSARAAGELQGVVDIAPTFRSLTVHYDPLLTTRAELEAAIRALSGSAQTGDVSQGTRWKLPVLYGGDGGPDLEALATAAGLQTSEAIDLHAAIPVSVHMLGFLPGFAFMGDIAEPLRQPRLKSPRLRVPPGSVAVADRLTAVYPWESPGGWHLIGICPVPFFDTGWAQPSLLAPADVVCFEPVTPNRHAEIVAALESGDLGPDDFRDKT
jgi:KipI family sensor histidine kinase inhibitor